MDNSLEDAVVLMSIKPQYVKAIIDGSKRIEFRKRKFAREIKYMLVYETSPSKTIVGYIEIKNIEIWPPDVMWKKYSKIGIITEEDYFSYYGSSEIAIGILIDKFTSFTNPINIKKIKITPPQSFRYITFDLFTQIKDCEGHPHA